MGFVSELKNIWLTKIGIFLQILEYYQTGVVVRPERLTLNYFLEQIELFDLEQDAIDKMLRKEGKARSPWWIRNVSYLRALKIC